MSRKFPPIVPNTIDYMLSHWPVQSIDKKISFIMGITDLLTGLEPEVQEPFIEPLFKHIAKAVPFSSPRLALAALHIHYDEDFIIIMTRFKEIIFPIYAPPVFTVMETHWNEDVRTAAAETAELLLKIDENLALMTSIEKKKDPSTYKMFMWRQAMEKAQENDEIDTTEFEQNLNKTFLMPDD